MRIYTFFKAPIDLWVTRILVTRHINGRVLTRRGDVNLWHLTHGHRLWGERKTPQYQAARLSSL